MDPTPSRPLFPKAVSAKVSVREGVGNIQPTREPECVEANETEGGKILSAGDGQPGSRGPAPRGAAAQASSRPGRSAVRVLRGPPAAPRDQPDARPQRPSMPSSAFEGPSLWRPAHKGITAIVVRPGSGARLGICIVGDDGPPAGRRGSTLARSPRFGLPGAWPACRQAGGGVRGAARASPSATASRLEGRGSRWSAPARSVGPHGPPGLARPARRPAPLTPGRRRTPGSSTRSPPRGPGSGRRPSCSRWRPSTGGSPASAGS